MFIIDGRFGLHQKLKIDFSDSLCLSSLYCQGLPAGFASMLTLFCCLFFESLFTKIEYFIFLPKFIQFLSFLFYRSFDYILWWKSKEIKRLKASLKNFSFLLDFLIKFNRFFYIVDLWSLLFYFGVTLFLFLIFTLIILLLLTLTILVVFVFILSSAFSHFISFPPFRRTKIKSLLPISTFLELTQYHNHMIEIETSSAFHKRPYRQMPSLNVQL